jgi:hypothetical protein
VVVVVVVVDDDDFAEADERCNGVLQVEPLLLTD